LRGKPKKYLRQKSIIDNRRAREPSGQQNLSSIREVLTLVKVAATLLHSWASYRKGGNGIEREKKL